MKIAVLGSGPSGLVAAEAVTECLFGTEHDLDIFSLGKKSPLYGAQYLHQPILGVTDFMKSIEVQYRLEGTADGYRQKVYPGSEGAEVSVSVEMLEPNHPAWDIRETYDRLWEDFGDLVVPSILNFEMVKVISRRYDLVLSTIPLPKICGAKHRFENANIVAAGSAPDLNIGLEEYKNLCPPNTVICNGDDRVPWYRISNIFGYVTAEFSMRYSSWAPKSASMVRKPLSHSCDCWDNSNVHLLGRYGAWKKGVLVHDVYEEVVRMLCQTDE